ncbi:peptide/nickel transport system permease protein [Symbiobacterium terraclitae]|uniref:Peptide/nickel transport system permease protein n=1 Tax=Symbiobacterium terraclitae TaxID=557451 RepID=A0ABS4JU13_9FIRM|nr:peptide/nickel transport system permease protein [Symbiobacterium terraclitae]
MAVTNPMPTPSPKTFDGLAPKETSYARMVFRRFLRNRMAIAGATILLILILISLFAPLITQATLGWGRDEIDIRYIRATPSARHPLGTDSAGRDNLTRLLYGGRVSLSIALGSVAIYMVMGIAIGSVAGYFGGWVDNVLMRLVDIIQSFPFLMFALTIVAIRGPSVSNLVFAIVFLSWPVPARLVRGEFLSLRERDFIEAARAMGVSGFRMIMRHLLPNAMAPLIVNATLEVAGIILAEAGLSYLGFGVKQPIPTWGNMLSEANSMAVLQTMPWTWLPPGLMIFLTVLSINFIGDGLRDALDPRLKQ